MKWSFVPIVAVCVTASQSAIVGQDRTARRLGETHQQEMDSLKRELDRVTADHGELHADVLPIFFAIRDLYMESGGYVPAASIMERGLAIAEEAHGPEDPTTLQAVNDLTRLYAYQRDYRNAQRYAERFRSAIEELVGTEHPGYGLALTLEGEVLLRSGDAAEAADRLQTALDILTTMMGPASHEATDTRLLLAEADLRQGRVRRAGQLLKYGLAIRSEAQTFGESETAAGLYMAPFMSLLGALYTTAGFYEEAGEILTEAEKAYEASLDDNHPDLESILVHLATLREAKGDHDASSRYRERAQQVHAVNVGFAFVEGGARYAPLAVMPPTSVPTGLFATAAVGDWVEYQENGDPSERLEIMRATPAAVIIAISEPDGDDWSIYQEEIVRRDIDVTEFYSIDSLTTTTCPFVTGHVDCFGWQTEGSLPDDARAALFVPDTIPFGGLVRVENDRYVRTLTRYRRGDDVVTVPEFEGLQVLAGAVVEEGGVEQLIGAARRGDLTAIEDALNSGMDVNAGEGEALNSAVSEGHVELVEFLIARGAQNPQAIVTAARHGFVELARLLLRAGADPEGPSGVGDDPPLYVAVRNGHADMVELLLEWGTDPNLRIGSRTVLTVAARVGNVDIGDLLIAAGAAPNGRPKGGRTPLMAGAEEGHVGFVRMLIDAGASVNAGTNSGYTALQGATKKGHTEVVRVLEAAGARQ